MSGYKHIETDLDILFEPLRVGDTKHTQLVDVVDTTGKDATDKYAIASVGAQLPFDSGYLSGAVDFRRIFAAKGSVPRYNAIPWARTVSPSTTKIYRQPSRALVTTLDMSCQILSTGHAEIKLTKPKANSHPTDKDTETFYALTGNPGWNMADVPSGVFYEIRFDVGAGSGFVLDGGMSFGNWYRIPVGAVGTILRSKLSYRHDTGSIGVKSNNGAVNISIRRSDYPSTNKTTDTLTTNLSFEVLDSLFSPVSNWEKSITVANTDSNPHDPDGTSANYTAAIRATLKQDGILTYSTQKQSSPWTTTVSTRWRAITSLVPATDFEVRCIVNSQSGGSVSNPISSWTQMNGDKVITYTQSVGNGNVPNTYNGAATLTLYFKQISTKGWAGLADNYVSGSVSLSSSVAIGAPIGFVWPDLSAWGGNHTATMSVPYHPVTLPTATEHITVTFTPDGNVVVADSDGTIASGRWLPNGISAAEVEAKAVLSASGTPPADETNNLATWTKITSTKVIKTVSTRVGTAGEGESHRHYLGSVSFRRAAFPSDITSISLDLLVTAILDEPDAPIWTGMTLPNLHRTITEVTNYDDDTDTDYVTTGVRWFMPGNGGLDGNHAFGQAIRGNDGGYLDTLESTRIVPVGWDPNDFEWRYTSVGGNHTPGPMDGVWLPMGTAGHTVWCVASILRSAGPIVYTKTLGLEIDVRRKLFPTQTYTFSTSLSATVELTEPEGPDWTGMSFPDFLDEANPPGNLPNQSAGSQVGLIVKPNTDLNAMHVTLKRYSYVNSGGNPEETLFARLVPPGWNPNDFEWKYEVVSSSGIGAMGGASAGTWHNPLSGDAHFYANTIIVSANKAPGFIQQYKAYIRLTVRHKQFTNQSYTFPDFFMLAKIEFADQPLTLVPPGSYANWGGTYYHTTNFTVPVTTEPGGWDGLAYEGSVYESAASYAFIFKPDGTWTWDGNGKIQDDRSGVWHASGDSLPMNGQDYDIRWLSITSNTGNSTNITTSWQPLSVNRTLTMVVARPPGGEPENIRLFNGIAQIRKRSTGQIITEGQINAKVTSWNGNTNPL